MKYHIYYPTFLLLPSNASYYVMKSLLATHSLKNILKRFYVDESSQNYDELKEGMKDVYTIQGNLDEEMKKIEERIKSARENLVKIKADKENFDTIQKQFEYISRAFKEQSNNENTGINAESNNEDNGINAESNNEDNGINAESNNEDNGNKF